MSIDTALSGLLAYQQALSTTSHNISNATTEGYSRQRVDLVTRDPQLLGPGYVGKGVSAAAIERSYDQFLTNQVVNRTSSVNQYQTYSGIASQLDTSLGSTDAGLSSALSDFFNAVQDVASNPTSTPARQVMLSAAETLNNRFQSIDKQITDLGNSVNGQLSAMVSDVNSLGSSIADLNTQIVSAYGATGGNGAPNDLLDQRDRLVQQLAEYTNVTTIEQSDHSLSVFVGSGQALVLEGSYNTMSVVNNEFDLNARDIAFTSGGINSVVTDQLTGGKLGGLLDVENEVLDPARNNLGKIAMGLANQFNTQHQLGEDINGNAGGLFFTAVDSSSPTVLPSGDNATTSGNFSVTIDDVNSIQGSDYRLSYDGTNFTLLRLSDNTVVDSGFTTGDLPRSVASEGITLSLTGTVAAGDSFLVRPTYYAAGQTGLAISDPAEIAAATAGTAVGNNGNALVLAGLQTTKGMDGSTSTYNQVYSQLVSDVGVKTHQADTAAKAQTVLLNQAIESRNSVSGVNLDEEAANLIKYQQAYQAAAQAITASQNLFNILVHAVGG
jgi:flagellar hook-associated protein 1 FlgK